MPLYDFKCPACGYLIELVLYDKNRNLEIICEDCGELMYREPSKIGGIKFKGGGFYETDYKKGDN